ncbi:hypothetical protein RRG08_003895, partial [Elysia crispata]
MFYSWPRSTGLLLLVALSFPFCSALNLTENNYQLKRGQRVSSGAFQKIEEITGPAVQETSEGIHDNFVRFTSDNTVACK